MRTGHGDGCVAARLQCPKIVSEEHTRTYVVAREGCSGARLVHVKVEYGCGPIRDRGIIHIRESPFPLGGLLLGGSVLGHNLLLGGDLLGRHLLGGDLHWSRFLV